MKKTVISSFALVAMFLGFSSFAKAQDIRQYSELSLLQQMQYEKMSEQEKQNTKASFGFFVYTSQNANCAITATDNAERIEKLSGK